MDTLRLPFFILAIVAAALIILVELGSALILGGDSAGSSLVQQISDLPAAPSDASGVEEPPGRGIGQLALVDVIMLYTVLLMGAGLLLPDRLHGRLQGIVTLIGSIVLIIVAFVFTMIALVEVMIMMTLLAATPFGTIAYLALWGFFPRGDAAVLLSLLMFLKIVFAVLLVFAQQRFLQNKGLVLIILTSLLCNVILAFLHGLVPIILVSIVDDVAAILFGIIAIIWGLILLIGSIPSVIKAIQATISSAARRG
jgi:hypothetical protein